jgi:hypothetical protein
MVVVVAEALDVEEDAAAPVQWAGADLSAGRFAAWAALDGRAGDLGRGTVPWDVGGNVVVGEEGAFGAAAYFHGGKVVVVGYGEEGVVVGVRELRLRVLGGFVVA